MSKSLSQEERQRFLAALAEDAAFLSAVRRLVLTEELLSLPDALTRLVGAVGLLVQEVRQGFAQVDARFAQVDARFDRMDARFDRMDARFDRMDIDIVQLKVDVSQLKGGHFESRWRENAPAYLGSRGYRRLKLIRKAELADLLDDALDDGRLTDSSVRDDILLLDALHRGRRLVDGVEVVVASEVASRVHLDDVERARRRGAELGAVIGVQAVACVAGASVDEAAARAAEAKGVLVVLPSEWLRADTT